MGSSNPPPPPAPVELAAVNDLDLGSMRLVREAFYVKDDGGADWKRLDMFSWEGALAGAPFTIRVESEGDFPHMPATARAMFMRLAASEAAVRREVAQRKLNLAMDWADSGDLPEPTEDSLFAALRLSGIDTYTDWRPTLWFQEIETDQARSIFAGHSLEVRCNEDGQIEEVALAG